MNKNFYTLEAVESKYCKNSWMYKLLGFSLGGHSPRENRGGNPCNDQKVRTITCLGRGEIVLKIAFYARPRLQSWLMSDFKMDLVEWVSNWIIIRLCDISRCNLSQICQKFHCKTVKELKQFRKSPLEKCLWESI